MMKFQTTGEDIWNSLKSFVDVKTLMVYDYRIEGSTLSGNFLPTPEEIADDIPNQCGWASGMEDCALNAGLAIPYLILQADHTKEENWRNVALQMADSLLNLATVGKTDGFLARGVLPDGKSHYRNSSVDQYTMAFYAMYRLWAWPDTGEVRRKKIVSFMTSAVDMMERHDWNIPTEDGQDAWVCETSQYGPDRASRLLQFVLGAYAVSGDNKYLQLYRKLRDEAKHRRIRGLFCLPNYRMVPYAILQTQVSLRMLCDLEPDGEFRKIWEMHLDDFAEHAVRRLEETDCDDLKTKLLQLPLINDDATWRTLFTPADYDARKDISKVAQQEGCLVSRFWRACPRTYMEDQTVRHILELVLTYSLADSDKLIDAFRKPLREPVNEYYQVIVENVDVDELLTAHSLIALLCCKIVMPHVTSCENVL